MYYYFVNFYPFLISSTDLPQPEREIAFVGLPPVVGKNLGNGYHH
jgi:hypothetical protein